MNVCGACGLDFSSLGGFEDHRVGRHAYTYSEGVKMDPIREDGRRCLTPAELSERGMRQNALGRWTLPGPHPDAPGPSWVTPQISEGHL